MDGSLSTMLITTVRLTKFLVPSVMEKEFWIVRFNNLGEHSRPTTCHYNFKLVIQDQLRLTGRDG
jgi:hypothetical protein